VIDTPLIPAALYGLRTWRTAVDARGEFLTGAYHATAWPGDGEWLDAVCGCLRDHLAPGPECTCGVHGWHPDRASARRVLATRFEVPGIVEAAGAAQIHEDGFRAARARPYALIVTPGRNARLVARLGERYGAEVVQVDGADALLAWCRERGLGLERRVVDELLGPEQAAQRRAARHRRRRRDVLRLTALVALGGAFVVSGMTFASEPPSPHGVYGRTGWVRCPEPSPPPVHGTAQASAPPRQPPC
jgi:hypothetical protein